MSTGLKKSAIILKVKKLHQKLAEKPTGIKKKRLPQEKKTCWIKILDYLKTKLISYEEYQKDYKPILMYEEKNATAENIKKYASGMKNASSKALREKILFGSI